MSVVRSRVRVVVLVGIAIALGVAIAACGRHRSPSCAGVAIAPGDVRDCAVPGWAERGFTIEVPRSWDRRAPLALVIALHGGGGNRNAAGTVACPGGDLANPECLSEVAKRAGFAVVRPDGIGSGALANVRTWNAGGGSGKWNCTSGPACRQGIDDVAYVDALLAEIARIIPVDPKRVHATGLSNGGAMSHRLACERGDRFASIASVGGGNQLAAAGGKCAGGVAVLEIHGTDDPCWGYDESNRACLDDEGIKVGVRETMEGWRARNGCSAEHDDEVLPDRDPADGTRATRTRWRDCRARVILIRIDGGGHTWPNGDRYSSEKRIGKVSRDLGSEAVVDFFLANPKP
jgi:polyhydroxybutyrate depolymerase